MGATFDVVDIPEDMKDEVEKFRGELIEAVAEYDENLLEKYFEDPESISEDEIHNALRADTGYEYYSYDLWFCFQKQRCSVFIGCCLSLFAFARR